MMMMTVLAYHRRRRKIPKIGYLSRFVGVPRERFLAPVLEGCRQRGKVVCCAVA